MSTIKSLTGTDILKFLKNNKMFVGVYPCDAIPEFDQRPCALIANTDPAGEIGEHWVAIILKEKDRAIYFDPFGFPPLIPSLQLYLDKWGSRKLTMSSITLQNPNGKMCGFYCVLFIHLYSKKWNLRQFYSFFSGRIGAELLLNDNKLMTLFNL